MFDVIRAFILSGISLATPVAALSQPTPSPDVPRPPVGMTNENFCPPGHNYQLVGDLFLKIQAAGSMEAFSKNIDAATTQQLAELKRVGEAKRAWDWADLCGYKADDARLKDSHPDVVFMGDSITQFWGNYDPTMFNDKRLNRGIPSQTGSQMVLRFMQDVVSLKPRVVHIMSGINDIAGNNGPVSPEDYKDYIRAMVSMAQANGIRVVLASITPANAFPWLPSVKPAPWITQLNDWLRVYAAEKGAVYVDYHSALAGPAGELPSRYAADGVHPNKAAYAIMRPLAEAAIRKAATAPSEQTDQVR